MGWNETNSYVTKIAIFYADANDDLLLVDDKEFFEVTYDFDEDDPTVGIEFAKKVKSRRIRI